MKGSMGKRRRVLLAALGLGCAWPAARARTAAAGSALVRKVLGAVGG